MGRSRARDLMWLPVGFAAATFLPGVWTMSQTAVSGIGMNIGHGVSQRIYEARFEERFPYGEQLAQGWTAIKLQTFGELSKGAVLGADGVLFTAEEFQQPAQEVDFVLALARAKQEVEAAGGMLLPLIIPDKVRMRSSAVAYARSQPFETRYVRALAEITAAGLYALDLRPALAAPDAFMRTDTHWSPKGAEAVAEAVAHSMESLFAQAPWKPQAFETQATGTRAFAGDLTVFADTGGWQTRFGVFEEPLTTYETGLTDTEDAALGIGLFDEVQVPVALVGTSFSAKEAFHFEGFLKSALGADLINHAQIGHGPFDPMEAFLARLPDEAMPPSLVIWEIPERYIPTWRTP